MEERNKAEQLRSAYNADRNVLTERMLKLEQDLTSK
jgi:hypothetical protein